MPGESSSAGLTLNPPPKLSGSNLLDIIQHVFLPRKLPNEIQHNLSKIETNLLHCTKDLITKVSNEVFQNALPHTTKLFQDWVPFQTCLDRGFDLACDPDGLNAISQLSEVIDSMQEGNTLAMYIRAQNAGFLVSIPTKIELEQYSKSNSIDRQNCAIFSPFQASPSSKAVMSTTADLSILFPELSVLIPRRSLLSSKEFLLELNQLTGKAFSMAKPKSRKADRNFNEDRDVVDPMLITEWATQTLCNSESKMFEGLSSILKKVRDDVVWGGGNIPFRRSGLWITIKVALQFILIRELGIENGTTAYKIIMIHLMEGILQNYTAEEEYNWDLKRQMMAKIARRIHKLGLRISEIEERTPTVQLLIEGYTKLSVQVTTTIQQVRKVMDSEWTKISYQPEALIERIEVPKSKLEQDCYHSIPELKSFLQEREKQMSTQEEIPFTIPTPSCPIRIKNPTTVPKLTSVGQNYEGDILLLDIEQFIRHNLDNFCAPEYSKPIRELTMQYATSAISQYQNDPIANSRMVLCILKCVQVLDKIAVQKYPLLLKHHSGVHLDTLQCLLLPLKEYMQLLHQLEIYFSNRDQNSSKYPSLIEECRPSEISFSVLFAKEDKLSVYKQLRENILAQSEIDIANKKNEVGRVKEELRQLRIRINSASHDETYSSYHQKRIHSQHCLKCYMDNTQYPNLEKSVRPYERPLSLDENEQYAVVFELKIPSEIACLRDMLHFFRRSICGQNCFGADKVKIHTFWTNYDPLRQHSNGESSVVQLGSTSKPCLVSHYSGSLSVSSSAEEDFILNNGLNQRFHGVPKFTGNQSLQKRCTYQIDENHPAYNGLQWTLDSTGHTSNEVIASQYSCSTSLSLAEFTEFGSLRAGHRLQYQNIYRSLVNGNLSLKNEPVFQLLCQAMWQAGLRSAHVSRESHDAFSEQYFAEETLDLLQKQVEAYAENWSEPFVMICLTTLASRLLELVPVGNLKNKTAKILRRCRQIANTWISTIGKLIGKAYNAPDDEKMTLRTKIIDASTCLALSFHVGTENVGFVMATSEDLVMWFNASSTLYDEIHWNPKVLKSLNLSPTQRSLLRLTNNAGSRMENQIHRVIASTMGEPLAQFSIKRWQGARSFEENWQKDPSIDRVQIYTCTDARSVTESKHVIHIDVLLGKFLLDGYPVGRLPEEIVKHGLYQRVFGTANFSVQRDRSQVFETTEEYKGCTYRFRIKDQQLIVREYFRQEDRKLELVPHVLFDDNIPHNLRLNYSHWWNISQGTILFRPESFDDPEFTNPIPFILSLSKMTLRQTEFDSILIYIKSQSFSDITSILQRIESAHFIHIWTNDTAVDVELVRIGLQFHLEEGDLMSHEFPGMAVCKNQNIGTLIGLQNKLVLEGKKLSPFVHPERRVIIPHTTISIYNEDTHHQHVTLDLEHLRQPSFFDFEVDERFEVLKAGRNQSAWLYLAALHGATGSPLPDPFTKVTGTEMAFQILQSARCWSCQPYDSECLKTLRMLASFSPRRVFYPHYLEVMQQVEWPTALQPTVAHEGYYIIVSKLIEDSNTLKPIFNGVNPKKIGEDNEEVSEDRVPKLALRHYWRQIKYENSLAQVYESFDAKFFNDMPLSQFYKRISLLPSESTKRKNIRIISELCQTQTFCLSQYDISSVKELLISKESLQGTTARMAECMDYANITNWIRYNIRDKWLVLYHFALRVKAEKLQSMWNFLLSTMAFIGVDLVHLHILQIVAYHGTEVFPVPQVPTVPEELLTYSDPSQTFTKSEIRQILRENSREFQKRDGYGNGIYSTKYDKNVAKNYHNEEVDDQIKKHSDLIEKEWVQQPAPKYLWNGSISTSHLQKEAAEVKINRKLNQWYDNFKLTSFIEEIEDRLGEILKSNSIHNRNGTLEFSQVGHELVKEPEIQKQRQFIWIGFLNPDLNSNAELTSKLSAIYATGTTEVINRENDDQQNLEQLRSFSKPTMELLHRTLMPTGSEVLVASGLYPRVSPTCLFQFLLKPSPTQDWQTVNKMIGAIGVLWTLEQRLIRCILYRSQLPGMEVALRRDIETVGYEDWSPIDHPTWLLLQLEMNMMIRQIQVEVAQQMMSPSSGENSVMQLNMGEGKTSVIVPMLAAELANGNQLCRITVIKAIFETNLNSLRHTLGGLLNRRMCTVPCRRDLDIGETQLDIMLGMYKRCMQSQGIAITLPEYRLSFQLKGYEASRQINEKTKKTKPPPPSPIECSKLIEIQRWLDQSTRDILDESDEILSVKYQVVYTVGDQLPVIGGGSLRWELAQKLLKRVPFAMEQLRDRHGDSVVECDKTSVTGTGSFTHCRLLDKDVYNELVNILADDFLSGEVISFSQLRQDQRRLIKLFITTDSISDEDHQAALGIFDGEKRDIVLIMAGYLRYGVLEVALGKRWRVNYGVNLPGHRKMAVPFKAKDVASERTEFGHPDMAIVLTQLSYYYSGLSDSQLIQCFDELRKKHANPVDEYDSWIQTISGAVDQSIQHYNGVNLADFQQRTEKLFPLLQRNMAVIDFWLSTFVFPKESKLFPGKMTCTAWDLCSENQSLLTTGFSGTNDSSNLLPLNIQQDDLPGLLYTNKQLEDTLLSDENNSYLALEEGCSGAQIITLLHRDGIQVLLDCGALMLELNNEKVANTWLQIDTNIQAVVFFNHKNILTAKERNGKECQFEISPFRERLSECAVYLDDEHTRGTDIKFPRKFKAAVTLGGGLTRDKMGQACMRMRLLGRGHTIKFFASHEAHSKLRGNSSEVGSREVLKWVRQNSDEFQNQGLIYWTASAVNYCRKRTAELIFQATESEEYERLGVQCTEAEVTTLMDMYGHLRRKESFVNIIPSWFESCKQKLKDPITSLLNAHSELESKIDELFARVKLDVVGRCRKFIPKKEAFSQLLEEEQERELEQELEEEKEVSRPSKATPHKHHLTPSVKNMILNGQLLETSVTVDENGNTIQDILNLPFAFRNTKLCEKVNLLAQLDSWGDRIFATDDFVNSVVPAHPSDPVDTFLRPPAWIVRMRSKKSGQCLLIISPYEANEVISHFKQQKTKSTLHMFTPRRLPGQDVLIDRGKLCIPPSSGTDLTTTDKLIAPLHLFSGCLYFISKVEQENFGNFLGIVPTPRKKEHQEAFESGWITPNGFLLPEHRHEVNSSIRTGAFTTNPEPMVREILNLRHECYIPPASHVIKLVVDGINTNFD